VHSRRFHPFLDGNEVGRLADTAAVVRPADSARALLYLSLYFKVHRHTYYELLNEVAAAGDWETWLEFFARCCRGECGAGD